MNKDVIEGNWQELKGKVQQMWGKLTDDDLDIIDGKRQELLGIIQKRYGYTKERAETDLKSFLDDERDDQNLEYHGYPLVDNHGNPIAP